MPRRRALTEAQLQTLFALPTTEANLIRHWTLGSDRRRDHNRLGFALQLCALRYPGRLLRPGEVIPEEALRFVADQLGADLEVLTGYAARFQTRYEQLDALPEVFGFSDLTPVRRREMLAWLLPVALSPLRRRATLVATVLDTTTRLTDEGVTLFDRAVGRMFRRAEVKEERAVLRDARAVNAKVRMLAKLGTALIEAKESGEDLDGAVAASVGWDKLAASIAEA